MLRSEVGQDGAVDEGGIKDIEEEEEDADGDGSGDNDKSREVVEGEGEGEEGGLDESKEEGMHSRLAEWTARYTSRCSATVKLS